GREDAEFGQRRLAPDEVENALVFVGLQTVFGDQLRRDLDVVRYHATASSTLSKRARPSVAPFIGSIMFSGCGIMPKTLPRSFRMPAMSFSEPLGFVPSA